MLRQKLIDSAVDHRKVSRYVRSYFYVRTIYETRANEKERKTRRGRNLSYVLAGKIDAKIFNDYERSIS